MKSAAKIAARARTIAEPARRIPVIGGYDVVVVGGGVAGVAAALAAARNGATTAIVEKENALGGLATLGLVVGYLPLCDGLGNQVIAGLGEELLKLSIRHGPGRIPACWSRPASRAARARQRYALEFTPAPFMIAMEEAVLKEGITLLYDTRFCDVALRGGGIRALIVENKSGRGAVLCRTVVDSSGDADVCRQAGERTVSLNTNRRNGWFYAWQKDRLQLHILGDPYAETPPPGVRTYSGDRWQDVTDMSVEGRRLIMRKIDELRGRRPCRDCYPALIPTIPQFRMTRRLKGPLEIDERDDRRWFEDTVGMTGDWRRPGPVLSLPFRCLIGARTRNLITAGRCISATRSAWDITRAIPTCAVTGEAAGTAAAMAARHGASFAELPVAHLQRRLKKQGVILDERLCRPPAPAAAARRPRLK